MSDIKNKNLFDFKHLPVIQQRFMDFQLNHTDEISYRRALEEIKEFGLSEELAKAILSVHESLLPQFFKAGCVFMSGLETMPESYRFKASAPEQTTFQICSEVILNETKDVYLSAHVGFTVYSEEETTETLYAAIKEDFAKRYDSKIVEFTPTIEGYFKSDFLERANLFVEDAVATLPNTWAIVSGPGGGKTTALGYNQVVSLDNYFFFIVVRLNFKPETVKVEQAIVPDNVESIF